VAWTGKLTQPVEFIFSTGRAQREQIRALASPAEPPNAAQRLTRHACHPSAHPQFPTHTQSPAHTHMPASTNHDAHTHVHTSVFSGGAGTGVVHAMARARAVEQATPALPQGPALQGLEQGAPGLQRGACAQGLQQGIPALGPEPGEPCPGLVSRKPEQSTPLPHMNGHAQEHDTVHEAPPTARRCNARLDSACAGEGGARCHTAHLEGCEAERPDSASVSSCEAVAATADALEGGSGARPMPPAKRAAQGTAATLPSREPADASRCRSAS
jgi:hypothetical protein